jgi:hypothetical protein
MSKFGITIQELSWLKLFWHFATAQGDRYCYSKRTDVEQLSNLVANWQGRVMEQEGRIKTLEAQNSTLLAYVTFPYIETKLKQVADDKEVEHTSKDN